MKEFDTDYTDIIICPYCGASFDPFEFGDDYFTEKEGIEECYECGRVYQVRGNVEWTWSTQKIKVVQSLFRIRLEKPGTEPVEVVLSAKDANEAYTAAEQMSIELLGDIYKIEIEDIKELRPKTSDV